ncbi:MAG: YhfC family glutamic-type intramembrane protease [Anaerolineales bacterium]|jgi:uncharacterized membrane protein YhfC
MLTVAHVLNFTVMIALPLALGIWMKKRFGLSWALFGWGALTFIASQVLHVPFNQIVLVPWIVRLGFPESGSGLVIGSLLVGLSAGVFEELARYVVLRRWAGGARSWRSGLFYGVGHGGAEAIIFGGLALFAFVQAVALRDADLVALLGAQQAALAQEQLGVYWSMSPGLALLGAVERFFALLVQMSAALMVVAAVARKERRWLVAAILWHTVVDAAAVYIMQRLGVYAAEAAVFIMALLALGFIFWARRDGLLPVGDVGGDAPERLRPGSSRIRNQGETDEINEQLDQSRYV